MTRCRQFRDKTGNGLNDAAQITPVTGTAPRSVERTTALRGRGIVPVKKSRPSALMHDDDA